MKIFGRVRDSLRIKKVKASRALYMDGPGTQEIEISLLTDDGERLDLQFPYHLAPQLIHELTSAYEAINPPISRGFNPASGWAGN